MKRTLRIISLFMLNVALSLALLEVLLRLFAPNMNGQIGVIARYVTTGQPYSEAWTPAWQQNRDHYYILRPNITDELQYGSPNVSFRLSTVELWEGGGIGFRTDLINFFVDAVVVGDSFGLCFTERADCWVDLLGQQMDWGMVNLSQPITGTTSHYRILRDFGAPLKPPTVIWQFFGNDFNDDYGLAVFNREISAFSEGETVCPDAPPSSELAKVLRETSVLYAILETFANGRYLGAPTDNCEFEKPYSVRYGNENQYVMQFGGLYEQKALDMARPENQDGLERSMVALKQAQELVNTWNGDFLIVIIPTREEVYSPLTAPIMGEEAIVRLASARLAMLDVCEEMALRCFDAIDVFTERAERGESLYHVDDMHLNVHGNAVLAEAIAQLLNDN